MRILLLFLIISLLTLPAHAKRMTPVKKLKVPQVYLIDNFADATHLQNPEWWKIGQVEAKVEPNKDKTPKYLGKYALTLKGTTGQWYIGGVGRYLGIDMGPYTHIKLLIKGNGLNSGILKVELYDDDNLNWTVDLDKINGKPTEDDVFIKNIFIHWEGWKVITIPLSEFEDANPKVGDGEWNPYQSSKSGGLLQMQLILLTPKNAKGKVEIKIDTLKFAKL